MTPAQLDALCAGANKRLAEWIARSAGQHIRAMRESWSTPPRIEREVIAQYSRTDGRREYVNLTETLYPGDRIVFERVA